MSEVISLRHDGVSWTPTDDGQFVVLDMRTSRYLSLNASGSALWARLADGADAADLAEVLVAGFGQDRDSAARDVEAFLAALRDRDLLAG